MMTNDTLNVMPNFGQRLLQLGFLLFLLGLLTGFTFPIFVNSRMGLSSHLEGILNGMFLVLLGLVWPKLSLTLSLQKIAFIMAVYGAFANWLATWLAAFWGAGVSMPIAGAGHHGLEWQETIINVLLYSLSCAMLAVCILVIWGLRDSVPKDMQD